MPFSLEDKHTIKVLREQKLYGTTKILTMFPNKTWTLSGVKTVLSKIDATGSVDRCSGSGRPCTARSPDTIRDVQDLVLSGSEPRRLRGVGDSTGACVQATSINGSRAWKSCQRVKEEWDRPDQEVIDNAISEWRKRLTACVAAGGGHFEHSL